MRASQQLRIYGNDVREKGGGPNGILVTTEELEGIQTDQIMALIAKIKDGA